MSRKWTGKAPRWDWHKDAEGKTVGYVSVEATGVGMQGEDGADALCHLRALFCSEHGQWEAFWGHN